MSTRFFYKSKTEGLAATSYVKAWLFKALKETKLFMIGVAGGGIQFNDPRICYARILRSEDEGTDSGRLIGIGIASGYRDYRERFSPPVLMNSGDILLIKGHANPARNTHCYYEANNPLEFLGTSDGTSADIETGAEKILDSVTSANAYDAATDSNIVHALDYDEIIFAIECITNDVDIKIVADIEFGGDYDIELQAEVMLTAAADKSVYRLTEYYPFIKIRIKSNVGGAHGVVTAWYTIKGGWNGQL